MEDSWGVLNIFIQKSRHLNYFLIYLNVLNKQISCKLKADLFILGTLPFINLHAEMKDSVRNNASAISQDYKEK